jgi:PGF-pre-PGF domain-containing protein
MRNITIYGSIIILIILTFSLIPTNASKINETVNNNDPNAILLKNAQFITTDYTLQTVQSEQVLSSFPDDTDSYYIVQSTSYVTDEWKQSITDTGAVLFDYIPNNAFIVRMNSRVLTRVEALDTVQWIGIYLPCYKISHGLSGSYSTCSNAEQSIYVNITVLLFDAQDSMHISYEIQALGGIITDNAEDTLQVRIESSKIADIAAIPGVCWIEKLSRFVILNDVAANITNVYETRNTYGLNGSGQIVAVADTGLDTGVNDASMHDDFEGRIIEIYDTAGDKNLADIISGHGTHIVGSVLGDGSCSNGRFKGMAPQAELIFQAAGNNIDNIIVPNDLNDLFFQAYDNGARIHTNSWGDEDKNGEYTILSKDLDLFMWNHPDMLILMAAGNKGVDSDSDGIIDLYSICSPATAKNCISVGASENIRSDKLDSYSTLKNGTKRFPSYPINSDKMANNTEGLAAFSSRGPTDDGRIKPDVVAPGTYIISTKSSVKNPNYELWDDYDANSNYTYGGGTSMSTPIVAGTAALIRQYYMQNESITPTAALLKATIINGAYNMVPGQYGIGQYKEIQTRPDNASGWGRIDIENSLFPASPRIMQYHDNISLNTFESWNAKYYSNNNSEPLQITLVWTDYPSIPSAAKTLVNNLDLTVLGPDGIYLGNGGDAINNVEQVELLTPVDGIYNITITGADIPHPPQPFALVISGALDLPPTISGEFPANNSYTGNNFTLVCVNITDTGSPVNESSINMTINGELVNITTTSITNGFRVQNQTVTPYNENIVTCSINASDINLNHRTYPWSFTVDITDPTSNTPKDVNYLADSTVNFTNWILNDQHPGYYRVLQNGTQIVESTLWSDNTNITVPVNTSAGIGDFNYTIQYNDSAGNSGIQDTVNINITDETPPILSDNTPATGTTDLTPPTISIKATDGGTYVNASSANMTVDGMQVVLTHTSSGITYTFSNDTTTTYNHGDTVNVTFSVSDNAGHISNKSWMFYIDNVAPMISITSPANNSSTSGITVSGTVNGTGSPPDITVTNSTGIDTTLTDFSASVPLLMGVNIIYANVSDQAGNTNTSFINITRIEPVVSSSSGGGGSSVGGGSSEAYENIEAKETQRVFVSKHNQIEFLFEKNENDIEYIKYRALKNTGIVSATIEILKDTSTIAGQPPSGIVYKNINMWVGKKGYATEKNMENPVIGFKVEKKWIESNDLEHGSITLNRYYNEEWIPLPTSKTNESASYIYFESQTSGFSPFAITGPKKLQTPSSSPQSPGDDASIDETPSTQEDPEEEGSISDKIFSINGVGANGSLGMLAILAGILIYNRKGKESI